MFFTRLLSRSFTRQPRRRGLIALTVALSTAISVAMLGVVLDVGDKLNAELTTYGSNIVVQPKADAVVSGLYETGDEPDPTSFLKEDEVGNIKTIFWAYNIVDFAPSLTEHLDVSSSTADGGAVRVNGTWFNKDLPLSTGESVTAGVTTLRSWWDLKGSWPQDDADETVVGSELASQLGVHEGDTVTLAGATGTKELTVTGVYTSGDNDDKTLYAPLAVVQDLSDHTGQIAKIEVKALTTPENELSRKAAANPKLLSQADWETWYCTAYPSSIAYQIEEVVTGSVAK